MDILGSAVSHVVLQQLIHSNSTDDKKQHNLTGISVCPSANRVLTATAARRHLLVVHLHVKLSGFQGYFRVYALTTRC